MYHGDAHYSTSHHTAAVEIPSPNTADHNSTFFLRVTRLWNEFPEEIVKIREKDDVKKDVNAFHGVLPHRPFPEWRGSAGHPRKKPT